MTASHLEMLAEDASTAAALRAIVPAVADGVGCEIHPYRGKADLLAKLPTRLRGYAARFEKDDWFAAHARVVVVLDRDGDDCRELRSRLDGMARAVGLSTRGERGVHVLPRIACEELEAWYFGDWEAVRRAYPRVPTNIPHQAAYRDPDGIAGGTWEAFERVMKNAGYFATGLRKLEAARAIGPHLDPDRNASPSFRALRDGIRRLVAP